MSNFWKSFLCVLACVFLCVASFFTGYFFRDTVRIKQSETINSLCAVKPADAVVSDYSFQGSNFPILVSFYNHNNSLNYNDPVLALLNSDLGFSEYIPFIFFLNKPAKYSENGQLGIGWNWSLPNIQDTGSVFIPLSSFNDSKYGVWQFATKYLSYPFNHNMFYAYNLERDFNFNVVKIIIESGTNFAANGLYSSNFKFYDNNGFSCQFEIVVDKNIQNISNYMLTSRTYFLTGDISSNDYYQQGYQVGYDSGINNGKQLGYNSGYSVGYSDGEVIGYNNGVNATNQYSFANLLTAVVEAPVNVFISLLDFNIMGYNLLSLVVGLLSLAVIVVIIKLCLGGK